MQTRTEKLKNKDGGKRTDRKLRQHGHQYERRVRMLGAETVEIDLACVPGDARWQGDACGREAVVCRRHAGGVCRSSILASPLVRAHGFDTYRALGTSRNARWKLGLSEPAITHVALADDSPGGVELRHAVGAVPCAVLASDAGIRAVANDARDVVLRVGVHRAARHARRLEAVIAAHREIVPLGVRVNSALDLAYASPEDVCRIAILLIAGDHTALAADALRHVEVEAILLAGAG